MPLFAIIVSKEQEVIVKAKDYTEALENAKSTVAFEDFADPGDYHAILKEQISSPQHYVLHPRYSRYIYSPINTVKYQCGSDCSDGCNYPDSGCGFKKH